MLVCGRGGSRVGDSGSAEFPWMYRKKGIESAIFRVAKYIFKNA